MQKKYGKRSAKLVSRPHKRQFHVFVKLQQKLKCKICDGEVKFFKRDERGVDFKFCVVCECDDTLIAPKLGKHMKLIDV
ncbi:hypothetical protein ABEB36_003106 [Hypothenemus hampei]|uniref:Uncharacterized protein n=1 Tax=Hypothenemus hampei TaxID=57062 RepID=A0ABD1F8R3_HYPHA